MKKVEIESFLKSFLLFFISLSSVIWFLMYKTYKSNIHDFEDSLYSQMKIASLSSERSPLFTKKIVPKRDDISLNTFYRDEKNFYIYFKSKDRKNLLIKVSYPLSGLNHDEEIIFKQSLWNFLKSLILIFFISIGFSIYALNPYRKYLKLTEEFIKDILHDFNTPISTMRLNLSLMKRDTDNKKIKRVEAGIETILNLQNNLKEYLENDIKKSEKFYLDKVITDRVTYLQGAYPHIKFDLQIPRKTAYCYKNGFVRIMDNILSNACKYNKKNGSVLIALKNDRKLYIKDTGRGIRNPKKIFDRFYKETSRGLGIGLHIVKKLSKKMDIPIQVESKKDKGTTFILNLSNIILD